MKKSTTPKKENKSTNVEKVNLSKYADRLKDVSISEKKKKDRKYKYPEGYTEIDINSEKGKKFRNSLRNQIKRFANNIFVYTKQNDAKKLKEEISLFNAFYKLNYLLNDYSVSSITQTKNESKEKDISFMLEIIKDLQK